MCYHLKVEFILKGIFFILRVGNKIKCEINTTIIAAYLFSLENKVLLKNSFIFWSIYTSVYLAMITKEENFYSPSNLFLEIMKFKTIEFNNIWTKRLEKKMFEMIFLGMFRKTGKFVLKKFGFRVYFDLGVGDNYIIRKSLELYKFSGNLQTGVMLFHRGQKIFFYETSIFVILSLKITKKCLFCSEIWIKSKNLSYSSLRWWKIFNVRETELEFFEQSYIQLKSSIILKCNQIRK